MHLNPSERTPLINILQLSRVQNELVIHSLNTESVTVDAKAAFTQLIFLSMLFEHNTQM